ncbi:MAG: hypothetical protein R2710_06960 [Acidimicrobiales bacterium]
MTLHGFTNDTGRASVCTGTCAEAWPPVIVGADWTVAPGLDSGIFNTTTRDDGSLQLVAGKWPLYYYGGDVAPGDVNGQGSGDVWFVAGTDGGLIQDEVAAASPGAGTADASVGAMTVGAVDGRDVLVDSSGMSLYSFLKDDAGEPTCTDGCANAWPPLLVDSADLPAGLDAEIFSVVAAGDGFQLKAGKWPLYRFAGDAEPGQGNGQGSGGEWFLVAPDGSLVRDDAGAEASSSDDGY